jgi:hypothetical protein
VNQWGLVYAWDCATANVHDTHFQPLIVQFDGHMIVLTDPGFHAMAGDPINMKVCLGGSWNTRMLVETVLSMLTTVCHCKQMHHRVWAYFQAHLAWIIAAFNILAQWTLKVEDNDMVHLSIAEFSL